MRELQTYPLVSIVTVNYNQSQVTCEFLASMRNVSYPALEVIVVDNGSLGDQPEIIVERFPEVILIQSEENLGFAGGNNLGIQRARGKYILFINNDTEVEKDFLQPMVRLLENDLSIGMVSPKIRYSYHPDTIQYAGFSKMNPYTLRMKAVGYKQKEAGQYEEVGETHFAHGCAMMVPVRVIEKVGVMPEMYFLYYEEHDWSTQIKKAGYRIFFQPQSVVFHKESISTGKNSPLKTYYLNRNRILYFRRHIRGGQAVMSFLYLSLIAVPKNFIGYLLSFQRAHLRAYMRAVFWHFRKLK
ncbi:glycosyltransferase family 2 protein [Marinilabiliaceae bacterium JC017]|nr:glycosyltransferase family 2 protein [Marinilabiliaceae bacterium JC017]